MTKEEAITKYIVPAIEKTWNDKVCKEILECIIHSLEQTKEIITYVSENFCDKYCKYPYLSLNQDTLDNICEHCPMCKLTEVFNDEKNIHNN